nr:hypothetical protein [Tanacetum cinerariifolium]
GALFTLEMLLIGSFSPTKVLLSHSSTPSTSIPSPNHNGLTFSKSTSPSSMSLFTNSLPRLSLMPLFVGRRVGLYSERESRDVATLSGLRKGECCYPVTKGVVKEDEGDDKEVDGEGGNEEAKGSVNIYQNRSAGDW